MRTGAVTARPTGLRRVAVGLGAALVVALSIAADGGAAQSEPTSNARSGELVKSFGDKGRRLDDFSGGWRDEAYGVAVQPDGKILVAGAVVPKFNGAIAVVRYLPSGRRDPSFGRKGVAWARKCAFATGVEVLPSGRIIVAGLCNSDLGLVQFTREGELDRSFDDDGMTSAPIHGSTFARALTVAPNGTITVAGISKSTITGLSLAVARFQPDGDLDTSFSDDGYGYTQFGRDLAARAFGVDLQSDGSAIIVGDLGAQWLLSRFTPAGRIDTQFGTDGVQQSSPVPFGVARAVEVLPDDRIVVVGEVEIPTGGYRMAAVAAMPNGEIDTSFGEGGITELDFGRGDDGAGGHAMAVDSKGRIVMAGYMVTGQDNRSGIPRFAVARLRPNGRLDRSFGGDGTVQTNLRPDLNKHHYDIAEAVAIAPNGDPVVAGTFDPRIGANNSRNDYATVRYRGG